MGLTSDIEQAADAFVDGSAFTERGGIITDLDGTAVHELNGRTHIPREVELALKRLQERGRPVAINTLRFPLSIMRTFGRAWYEVTTAPIPTVCLNGSLIGTIHLADGELAFRETEAFPVGPDEVAGAMAAVRELVEGGVAEVAVFHYPRRWDVGELIWTPDPRRVTFLAEKYRSATDVWSDSLDALQERLLGEDTCMIFLLVDIPQDHLMAYQHTRRESFVTRTGVNKRSGAQAIARALQISLEDSVGAGDTELDIFLDAVGLSVHVGHPSLPFRGHRDTLRIPDSMSLGLLLFRLGDRLPARGT
jgi:hydroxymethylpyrimidine pyrophosphatase-like HAD family hydrolase